MSANNQQITFSFSDVSNPNFTRGLRLMPWQVREGGKVVRTDVVSVLGSVARDSTVYGPFKTIPVNLDSKPVITRDGKYATIGSFQEIDKQGGGKQLMMVQLIDGNFYLHLKAAFQADRHGNIEGHINRLLLDGKTPSVPGSFSLDGASVVRLEDVEGLVISEEKAERLKWSRSKANPIIGGPGVKHDLWRMPPGTQVLAQSPEGLLFRYIHVKTNDGNEMKIEPADAIYAKVFMDMEMRRRDEARKSRDRRSQQKGEVTNSSPAPQTTT